MSSNELLKADDLESLLLTLQHTLGIVVPEEQRNSLIARIMPLLTKYECDSFTDFANSIENSKSDEIKSVVLDAVSRTQLTWSLNAEITDVLSNYIFSQLADNAKVWIVGCGQGQFAYAVAMAYAEYEHRNDKTKNIQFVATDIHDYDIKYAELGVYEPQQLTGLSEEYKKLYMTAGNNPDELQIKQKIRQQFSFSTCDLTGDVQSLGQMDLIVCPQTLVYFSNGIREAVIQKCADMLKSGGIFLTGNNQILVSAESDLEQVNHSTGVFYRQKN